MPGPIIPLTDEELADLAANPDDLARYLPKLTSDERRRLRAVHVPPATETPSAAWRLMKGVGRNLDPRPMVEALLTRRASIPFDILRASFEQGRKAFSAETPGEAFRLGLSTFPVIGPAAAATEETAKRGDVAGALGEAIGLALPFAVGGGLKGYAAARPTARATKAAILRKQAEQTVAQDVLAPTKPKYQAVAQRIAPEVLTRGLKGSRESLAVQAEGALARTGQALEDAIARYPKTQQILTKPIIQDIDASLTKLTAKGISGKVEVDPAALGQYKQLKTLRDFLARRGSQITFDQARALRQRWDTRAAEAGGFAQKTGDAALADRQWALREGAGALRREFAKERPDIATVNREISFWADLDDVLDPIRGKPKAEKGGGAGLRGALSGAVALSSPLGRVAGILGGSSLEQALVKAFQSPRWRLRSARHKYQLADALMRGEVGKAKQLLIRFEELMPREASMKREEPE